MILEPDQWNSIGCMRRLGKGVEGADKAEGKRRAGRNCFPLFLFSFGIRDIFLPLLFFLLHFT